MAFYNFPLRVLRYVQESHDQGKPLMSIAGVPMIKRVYAKAMQAAARLQGVQAVVATDERSGPDQESQWQTKDSRLYYHAYLRAAECVW